MKKTIFMMSALVILAMLLGACAPAEAPAAEEPVAEEPAAEEPAAEEPAAEEPANLGLQMEAAKVVPQYFVQAEYEESLALMEQEPLNPEDPIYLQYLIDNPIDTTEFKKDQNLWFVINLSIKDTLVNDS